MLHLLDNKEGNLVLLPGAISESQTKKEGVIDIIRTLENSYIHKQIEIRDGLLFMRLKKRKLAA